MAKNTAPKPPVAQSDDWDIPENYQETLTGFPPYWTPDTGAKWAGSIMMKDESGDFERYVVRATKPVMCQRGSGDELEPVLVRPGEFFTISLYSNLQLDRFIGTGGEVIVICKGKQKANTPAGFVWAFRVLLSPELDRAIAAQAVAKLNARPKHSELNAPTPASDEPRS